MDNMDFNQNNEFKLTTEDLLLQINSNTRTIKNILTFLAVLVCCGIGFVVFILLVDTFWW